MLLTTVLHTAPGNPSFYVPSSAAQVGANARWHLCGENGSFTAGSMLPAPRAGAQAQGIGTIVCNRKVQQSAANEVQAGPGATHEADTLCRLMLEYSAEGIYALRPDGTCLFINATGAQMLGYQEQELKDHSLHEVIHGRRADVSIYPALDCPIAAAARGGPAARVEGEVFWRRDGSALPVCYQVSPLMRSGQPEGAMVIFSNRTERREQQQADQKAWADHKQSLERTIAQLREADQRKTDFLATTAHELRHPLAPLGNGVSLLRMNTSSAAPRATLDMMERQISAMTRLIDDMLDIARITTGKIELKKEVVALETLINRAVETSRPLIDTRRHQLLVSLPEEPLLLEADPVRLVQVLTNLLNNAAKYTLDAGRIEVSAQRNGQEVVVSVADNGVGIPAEALPAIFDLFAQAGQNMDRAQGGLGVGLALVHQLVELHGGAVTGASPGAGRGSIFTVRLPLAKSNLKEVPNAPTHLQPLEMTAAPARGLRVLLVDDHAESARSLAAVLELKGHGHVVAVASESHQAVQLATHFRPEVAFLDLSMPGMDGYETAQALRQVKGLENLVLVALTGWADKRSRVRSAAAGFDHHLAKPVSLTAIDTLVSALAGPVAPCAQGDEKSEQAAI